MATLKFVKWMWFDVLTKLLWAYPYRLCICSALTQLVILLILLFPCICSQYMTWLLAAPRFLCVATITHTGLSLLMNLFNLQAFCPALIVPGIGYSDDKLLQSRIFSYADSQRHRLGPNYLTLPVNAPKSNYHNNHHEGFMNMTIRDEEVNYFPSRFDPVRQAQKYPENTQPIARGPIRRERAMIPKVNSPTDQFLECQIYILYEPSIQTIEPILAY